MTNRILIFKTNIQHPADVDKIKPTLTRHTITNWNVDVADIDCVLRVITPVHTENDIIEMITDLGYECAELN